MHSVRDDGALPPPGSPIQEPPDQRLLGSSPGSFAACYAFLRLLVPRHPPCTLSSLTTHFHFERVQRTPRYGVLLRFRRIPTIQLPKSSSRPLTMHHRGPRVKRILSKSPDPNPSQIDPASSESARHPKVTRLARDPPETRTRIDRRFLPFSGLWLPDAGFYLVEVTGFEPVTSWLQTRRSPTELHPRFQSGHATLSQDRSWFPEWWAQKDSNLRPYGYQPYALAN